MPPTLQTPPNASDATSSERAAAARPARSAPTNPASPNATVAWASGALLLTGALAVVAKIAGVVVLPGMRGVAVQSSVDTMDVVSSALGYTLAGMLVALVCGGSFELARATKIGTFARGLIVAMSGLVVALASPAVVQRLHTVATLSLASVTSLVAFTAGVVALRNPRTRALGTIFLLFSLSGMLRPLAWGLVGLAGERASLTMYQVGRGCGTGAVVTHMLGTLIAAAWLATRSRFRGRMLANAAVILAFAMTYLAARETEAPETELLAILRTSLVQTASASLSYGMSAIAAFLLPASLLLAIVALLQTKQPVALTVAFALALISQGAFDVPMQALAITAAAQWTLLAMVDDRAMWTAIIGKERSV
ncbi:hypothetical protein AKJ09_04645 [Labilithrix luteola]|uniref:Uncharacterized protein n=1 Tax=Labilithrix luteola TaxID=1391654 RepID=A0A0K1PX68_9BACT|nr:hypothetical protein [Labilithrix luteola]AKU97981.1 hypothetical protein AKJ09_04645 [Labilithrix luteola]